MNILIIGGSGSGKSALAERCAVRLAAPPRTYIATMQPYDDECLHRIDKHRKMRANKGFVTVERYTGLAGLRLEGSGTALIECLSNLVANEMYALGGAGSDCVQAVLRGAEEIAAQTQHLIVVSNEVFCDGAAYDESTMQYLHNLARINAALAERFDAVIEAVAGLPVVHKGEEVCAFLKP